MRPTVNRKFAKKGKPVGSVMLGDTALSDVAQRLAMASATDIVDTSVLVARDAVAVIGEVLQDEVDRTNAKVRLHRPASVVGRPPSGDRRPTSALSAISSASSNGGRKTLRKPPDPYALQWVARRNGNVELFQASAEASVAAVQALSTRTSALSQEHVSSAGRRGTLRAVLEAARDQQADNLRAVRRALLKLEKSAAAAVQRTKALGNEYVRHRKAEVLAAELTAIRAEDVQQATTRLSRPGSASTAAHLTSQTSIGCSPVASRPDSPAVPMTGNRSPKRMPIDVRVQTWMPMDPQLEVARGLGVARATPSPARGYSPHSTGKGRVTAAASSERELAVTAAAAAALLHSLPRSRFPANGSATAATQRMIAASAQRQASRAVAVVTEAKRLDALRFGMAWRRSGVAHAIDVPDAPLLASAAYHTLERAVRAVSPGGLRRRRHLIATDIISSLGAAASTSSHGCPHPDAAAVRAIDGLINASWHQGMRSASAMGSTGRRVVR